MLKASKMLTMDWSNSGPRGGAQNVKMKGVSIRSEVVQTLHVRLEGPRRPRRRRRHRRLARRRLTVLRTGLGILWSVAHAVAARLLAYRRFHRRGSCGCLLPTGETIAQPRQ